MEFNKEVVCIDKNGLTNTFKYSLETSEENGNPKWVFRIMPEDLEAIDWFEFSITKVNDSIGKVTAMAHNNLPVYIAKGIPDKMIEEAHQVLNLEITSSSNKPSAKSFENEWRAPDADKVWNRLIKQGKAVYDLSIDTYKLL